jgi:hydroxymethylglutaryl-CoA lyase
MVRGAARALPGLQLTLHFHNTRGMGLANVLAAVQAGIDRFDGSLGGLGGCPYAPGASGNISSEDAIHMLEAMGYDTGIDLAGAGHLLGQVARHRPACPPYVADRRPRRAGPGGRRPARITVPAAAATATSPARWWRAARQTAPACWCSTRATSASRR